jgi:chemotaxis protein CheD
MDANRFSPDRFKHLVRKPETSDPAPGEGRPTIYLHPGQVYIARDPAMITTVLGSCVAICLWDPTTAIGGANHYMLPANPGSGQDSARFGDVAFVQLLKGVLAAGAHGRQLRAKLFGGATVLKTLPTSGKLLGAQNVELAHRLLREQQIVLVEQDVEGTFSRKVTFHTDTGVITMRRL